MTQTAAMSEHSLIDSLHMAAEQIDPRPVNLDPPDPTLTRWQELAGRAKGIDHDGDAEKVIPFPRPAWADPTEDTVGSSASHSHYRSSWALVASRRSAGCDDGVVLIPAGVAVRAKVDGDGVHMIGIATRREIEGTIRSLEISLYPSEVSELIDVLHAAVDMIGAGQ